MKTISILVFSVIIVSVAFILSSCGDDTQSPPVTNNDDSCGNETDIFNVYTPPYTQYGFPSTYTSGSERYYNIFFEVDSICTDHHVWGEFTASSNNIPTIKFEAAIEWQVFWEKRDTGRVQLVNGIRLWTSGIYDLGLRVPFGDDPARVFVNIYIHFPTQGSATLDSIYFLQQVLGANIKFVNHYHKYPNPTASNNLINKYNYKDFAFIFYEMESRFDIIKPENLFMDNKRAFVVRDYNMF